ncbi:hypothetical protein RND81_01G134700 [Saponaria officinalis]|uniref:Aminotransferase-like plant mobile domain-containing protein n=1 Tax=Saponaria officinalis TaxID=3572 RepID=A0AAW1NF06_SAPOF
MACSLYVTTMAVTCSLHVLTMVVTCKLHVTAMVLACSLHVTAMVVACSLQVLAMVCTYKLRRRALRFSDTVSEPCGEPRQPPRVQTESDPGVLSPVATGASPFSFGAGQETQCGTSSRPRFRFVCSGSDTRRDSVVEGDNAGVSGAEGGGDGDREDDDLHGDVSTSSVVRVKRLRTGRLAVMEEGSGSGTGSRAGGTRGGGRRQRGTKTTWLLTGGSPGGPEDTSVIPIFGGHIACRLWLDPTLDRPVLVGYQMHNKLRELMGWRSIDDDMRAFLDDSGLRHLGGCMLAHIDMPLISAFVERWQPDTNTFHLPFGEMSILLHDVERILRLPIHGRVCGPSSFGEAGLDPTFYIAHLLGRQQQDLSGPWKAGSKAKIYKEGAVLTEAVRSVFTARTPADRAAAYLAVLLVSTVFVDKSGDRLRAAIFPLLGDLRNCWIYEYFPCFRSGGPPQPIDDGLPRALAWAQIPKFREDVESLRSYRRRIDALTPGMVIEPYQPDRCLRQFGYLQVIPQPMQAPPYAYRPATGLHYTVEYVGYSDHQWDTWIDHRVFLAYRSRPCTDFLRDICQDYVAWYRRHSHPRITQPSTTERGVTAADDLQLQIEVGRALAEAITPMDTARTTEETIRY